jgi:hypothetical protein
MDGKELLIQGLRRGIALWQIEDELDWQENQGLLLVECQCASSASIDSLIRDVTQQPANSLS